jgi:hypothetical protein
MINSIPKDSWTRKFSEKEPDSSVHAPAIPPWYDIIKLLPIAYRIGHHVNTERKNNREPIFDLHGIALQPPNPGPHGGVPLGGIGGGAIGRGYKGEFRRWSLHPGRYVHKAITADLFSLRVNRNGKIESVILSLLKPDDHSCLTNWNWHSPALPPHCATYHGLFPRAWTVYEDPLPNIRVIIKQISPFLPENYSETSLPTAVFDIEVENKSLTDDAEVSIMFTFQNGLDSDCYHDRYLSNFDHVVFQTEENKEKNNLFESPLPIGNTITGVSMQHSTLRTYVNHARETEPTIPSQNRPTTTTTATTAADHHSVDEGEAHHHSHLLCFNVFNEAEKITEYKVADPVSLAIGGIQTPTNKVTTCKQFISRPAVHATNMLSCSLNYHTMMYDSSKEWESADELWLQFHNSGEIKDHYFSPEKLEQEKDESSSLDSTSANKLYVSQRRYSSAVCIKETIPRGSKRDGIRKDYHRSNFKFALSWDYPLARFGSGKALPRYYTKFFSQEEHVAALGGNAALIASYALCHYPKWDEEIVSWQENIQKQLYPAKPSMEAEEQDQKDEGIPMSDPLKEEELMLSIPRDCSYYSYHLFNELYYLVDGGTLWLDSCNGVSNSNASQMIMMDRLSKSRSSNATSKKSVGVAPPGGGVLSNKKTNANISGGSTNSSDGNHSTSNLLLGLKDEHVEKTEQLSEKLLGKDSNENGEQAGN